MMKKTLREWCLENNRQDLLKQWDPSNNRTPDDTASFSKEIVSWIGKCSHTWTAPVFVRTRQNQNCPYCAGKRVLVGFNDVATYAPKLVKQWHPDNEKTPLDYTYGSHAKVKWICEKGHTWEAEIKSRVHGNNCPICAGQIAETGVNDILTINPPYMSEWDYTNNTGVDPKIITLKSNRKVSWKCNDCKNIWEATPYDRYVGKNCPKCAREYKTSFREKSIAFYLEQVIEIEENYHAYYLGKSEFDIFIPSLKIAIEYDGRAYHKSVSYDSIKNKICVDQDIRLFRIRENGCPEIGGCTVIYVENNSNDSLDAAIKELFVILSSDYGIKVPVIDVKNDLQSILAKKYTCKKEKSLMKLYPEIAKEFDNEKNNGLLASNIPAYSNHKVYWRCMRDDSYSSTVYARTYLNEGCPYCAGKLPIGGKTDLATTNPELISEWHPTKNHSKKISDYTNGSDEKIWWKCSKDHVWEATIYSRAKLKRKCPYCSKKMPIAGENDLATVCPDVLNEWDYKMNLKKPSEYFPKSNKMAYWICQYGHHYCQSICHHTSGEKCPICDGKQILIGFNDLQSQRPDISNMWHPTKNNGLKPNQVTTRSHKDVWWIGKCGHEWERPVYKATKHDENKCPYCNNHLLLIGFNDLATRRPDLIEEWDEDNEDDSCDILYCSHESRKWVCKRCGYKWSSQVYTRSMGDHGCTKCNHKKKQTLLSNTIQTTL